MIKSHEHLVPIVRRTAYRVANNDDAIADINCVQHGRAYTNVGFGPQYYQRIRLAFSKVFNSSDPAKAE
jgi:hypothetical protein